MFVIDFLGGFASGVGSSWANRYECASGVRLPSAEKTFAPSSGSAWPSTEANCKMIISMTRAYAFRPRPSSHRDV